jgi:hypothetical protein
MWFREQNETYYVTIDGQQIPLGKDEREARIRYCELVPLESRGEATDVRGSVSHAWRLTMPLDSYESTLAQNGKKSTVSGVRRVGTG